VDARRQVLTVAALPAELMVECDDIRVAQLIANVLGNASKYTQDEGTIDVVVWFEGNSVSVQVSDNGIGIAAERLTDIFKLYAQVDHGDARRRGGMGVGLSLALDLARSHGGTVQAFSDGPGHGSRFKIVLPIVAPPRTCTDTGSA
jgi:signal transduction histidine kinase